MHFQKLCAICGLNVAKSKVKDLGVSIDPEAVQMIKKTYVDPSIKLNEMVPGLKFLRLSDGCKPATATLVYARYQVQQPNGDKTHSVHLYLSKACVTPSLKTKSGCDKLDLGVSTQGLSSEASFYSPESSLPCSQVLTSSPAGSYCLVTPSAPSRLWSATRSCSM